MIPSHSSSAWLWLVDCEAESQPDVGLLSESELRRYAAIQHPLRQRQFAYGRLLLRHMLSRRFERPLEHWQLIEQAGQAPQLVSETPEPIRFSIAHSHHQVACLLTMDNVAGCDIEYMGKARSILEIAALYFAPESTQQLTALSGVEQEQTFYRLWTRHEALYKAATTQACSATALWKDYCLAVVLSSTPTEVEAQQVTLHAGMLALTPLSLRWEAMLSRA